MSRRRILPAPTEPTAAPVRPPPPALARISSGCTVTTRETALEAAWAARTFHRLHEAPVLLVCDAAAHAVLKAAFLPEQILLHRLPFAMPSQVRAHNRYHRSDAIAAKMTALSLAVQAFGDSVFFDADLTFLRPLPPPDDNELILSPNFEDYYTRGQHGLYNAGLLWTRAPDFADWWRSEFLSGRSRFYEQSALDLAPSRWRCSYYGPEHNHGFWRGPVASRRVHSIHCHLSTALDASMSPWARQRTQALRAEALALIAAHPQISTMTPDLP